MAGNGFFRKEYEEEFDPKHWLARSDVGGCDGGGRPASHARAGFGELIFSLSLYCSLFFFSSRIHLSLHCPCGAKVAAYYPHHKGVPLAAVEVDGQLLLAQLNRVREVMRLASSCMKPHRCLYRHLYLSLHRACAFVSFEVLMFVLFILYLYPHLLNVGILLILIVTIIDLY